MLCVSFIFTVTYRRMLRLEVPGEEDLRGDV